MATKKSIAERIGEIIILVFAIVCIALVVAHFYTTFSESYKTKKTDVNWAIGSKAKRSMNGWRRWITRINQSQDFM
jgi:hypothetical protein